MGRLEDDHRRYRALNSLFEVLFSGGTEPLKQALLQMGPHGRRAVSYIAFGGSTAIVNSNAAQELVRRGLYRPEEFATLLRLYGANSRDIRAAAEACGVEWSAVTALAGEDAELSREPVTASSAQSRVDVVIVTALVEECEAVRALHKDFATTRMDNFRFPYYFASFERGEGKAPLTVAVAWSGAMGRSAAVIRAQGLLQELSPRCLAMCGICAGVRGKVNLGDVIVADRVFNYDEGKQYTDRFAADIQTFNLLPEWKFGVDEFSRRWTIPGSRPLSIAHQREWLMRTLSEAVDGDGPFPQKHPDRKSRCPDWKSVLTSVRKKGWVTTSGGHLKLTDEGRDWIGEVMLESPDLEDEPSARVHIGPIAVGAAVVSDPRIFGEIQTRVRKVLGMDLETTGIAQMAANAKIPALLVKAVADHADADKDDRFHSFAASASAAFVVDFLKDFKDFLAQYG